MKNIQNSSTANSHNPEESLIQVVVFSKDRPLQLDATIRSLLHHCKDVDNINIKVIWTASNPEIGSLYKTVNSDFPQSYFIQEQSFRNDVFDAIGKAPLVFFLVDDNIFTGDFCTADIIKALDENSNCLGFSLRLGTNTTYCYMLNHHQNIPPMTQISDTVYKFSWKDAEFDFNYPLELSSSIYRTNEILPLLRSLNFFNPNTLEFEMSKKVEQYKEKQGQLLSFNLSVTFCAPMNKVQKIVLGNRMAGRVDYSPENLVHLYKQGMRIDVDSYSGFIPFACHQEVDFKLIPAQLEKPISNGIDEGIAITQPIKEQSSGFESPEQKLKNAELEYNELMLNMVQLKEKVTMYDHLEREMTETELKELQDEMLQLTSQEKELTAKILAIMKDMGTINPSTSNN